MHTNEIRQKYLDFFQSKGHTLVASDVLVPKWDPTVLFTPAGMNQFKDHFLGKVDLQFTRATSCQKCLRTGDIENVGRTAYHHTFFEMLGNFSFGDYFKREAIHWAWEFLTAKQWLAIDPNRLSVSVYQDDDEASDIWQREIGLPLNRIARLGEHDNFWPAGAPTDGPDGVCGPCSEIFFHPDGGDECEIWNLVFTQFNRQGDPPDNLTPLPNQNIDTGMGLERIAATMQGVTTNFHIDILKPLVFAAADVVGVEYQANSDNGRRLRRIADHVRACTMAIHENVYPGANKEEYVIRRLLRRAVLQGHEMGLRDPFLFQLVPQVVSLMSEPYPELRQTAERVAHVVKNEEQHFFGTLDAGLAKITTIFHQMQAANRSTVDGHEAFDLYQTFGIPAELFASIAAEKNCAFDWNGYQKALEQHGIDSGAGSKGVMGDFGPLDEIKREVKSTAFLGYQGASSQAVVCGLMVAEDCDGQDNTARVQKRVAELHPPLADLADRADRDQDLNQLQYLILDQSPFYAESGGQVGDQGEIVSDTGTFQVQDTQKSGDVIIHIGYLQQGTIRQGDMVAARVDQGRRDAIRRAHSATHVLHYALQKNLGHHAQQRGSKVVDDLLRFDFANLEPVSAEQLTQIETLVNQKIEAGGTVSAEILPLEQARQAGAMMLFGEKYPDPVRMVSIADFSKELCGGIHVDQIEEVESFEITVEENISAGTRRIQAITGRRAAENRRKTLRVAKALSRFWGVPLIHLPTQVAELQSLVKSLKKHGGSGSVQLTEELKKITQTPIEILDEQILMDASGNPIGYFDVRDLLKKISQGLNVGLSDLENRLISLRQEAVMLMEKIQNSPKFELDIDHLIAQAEQLDQDMTIIIHQLPESDPAQVKSWIDQIRKKKENLAIFFATPQGTQRVMVIAGISQSLVKQGLHAGNWIKHVAAAVEGRGGGKPDMAQAGGIDIEKLPAAMAAARNFFKR